jgi:hypothetical protein
MLFKYFQTNYTFNRPDGTCWKSAAILDCVLSYVIPFSRSEVTELPLSHLTYVTNLKIPIRGFSVVTSYIIQTLSV